MHLRLFLALSLLALGIPALGADEFLVYFGTHTSGESRGIYAHRFDAVTAFRYEAERGALNEIQTISTLPEGFEGRNSTAEVRVHPSGKFIYGSNRRHDSIVVYAVDAETGMLRAVEHVLTGGQRPRNFEIDASGRFLFAANLDTHNVVVLRIDPATGASRGTTGDPLYGLCALRGAVIRAPLLTEASFNRL